MSENAPPERFYTGLVSELYDPLVGEVARAEAYRPFILASGQPALEVFCGSGSPMIELLEEGIEVHGLDSSRDMLDVLERRADEAGVAPTIFCQTVQDMELPESYSTIFIAGASMTLLPSDEVAQEALSRFYRHLNPGGQILIPLEIPSIDEAKEQIGLFKEKTLPDGTCIRVGSIAVSGSDKEQWLTQTLRYDRTDKAGKTDRVIRNWDRRWWTQDQFRQMLEQAGFKNILTIKPEGGEAEPDDPVFVFIAGK